MNAPPKWVRDAGHLIHSLFLSWALQMSKQGGGGLIGLDLGGACVMASYVLTRVLTQLGHHAVFCYSEWEMHAWVEWRGWVLDVTATQFKPHHRRLRYLKIGSRKWRKDVYTDRWMGRKAFELCRDSGGPQYHRFRMKTVIRDVLREVRHANQGAHAETGGPPRAAVRRQAVRRGRELALGPPTNRGLTTGGEVRACA